MSESLDQPAALAIAPDDPQTNAQAQPPAPAQKSSAAEKEASPDSDEPETAPLSKAAGLPVPVVAPPQAEAPGPHAAAAEAHLNSIPFRSLPPRQKRAGSALKDIWFRAAAVAVALGIGWIAGANTFDRTEEVRRLALQLHATEAKLADVAKAARIGPEADLAAVKTDLAALKKSVDGLGKGLDTQRAGLGTTKTGLDTTRSDLESIKTALQAVQAGFDASKPDMAKLDRLAERVDRLEHQVSSLMPTGSISAAAPAAAGQSSSGAEKDRHALPSKEPGAAAERPKIPPNGYVLRDVHDGVAVVEDRTGLHEVVPGEVLAGIGRVESIERRGHRWVVVTSDGLIDSDPY